MTPEQQRIAIAQACGWTQHIDGYWSHLTLTPRGSVSAFTLPDYFNDLNAMHEAEKMLSQAQFASYLDKLDIECGGELELSAMVNGADFGFGLVHATASQRAEAFLKTLNLWKP